MHVWGCSPLIGGLNGSLGSRTQSGLSVGESNPSQRAGLPPPHSPLVSAPQQALSQAPATSQHQTGNDMQVRLNARAQHPELSVGPHVQLSSWPALLDCAMWSRI
jgi:hypothetical protein